jgi:hypothetical protein
MRERPLLRSSKRFFLFRTKRSVTKEQRRAYHGLVIPSGGRTCTATRMTTSRCVSCVAEGSRFRQSLSGFLPVPSRPWKTATVDFVVSLPPASYQGQVVDALLTATCPFSKMVDFLPVPSTATADDIAQVLYDAVYHRFRSPLNLISDRNPKFMSDIWRAYNKKVGTSRKMSTSAHPETDGRSEVTNKTVGQVLPLRRRAINLGGQDNVGGPFPPSSP